MGTLTRLLNHTVIDYAFAKLPIFLFCIYHINLTYCWATAVYANINIFHCLIKDILLKNLIFTLFFYSMCLKGK